jgi:4-alpha-glucanotransferase
MSATQGLLGYFYPAVPVTLEEFASRHIPFNYDRYCRPFINDQILWDWFGYEKEVISEHFMYQKMGFIILNQNMIRKENSQNISKKSKKWGRR